MRSRSIATLFALLCWAGLLAAQPPGILPGQSTGTIPHFRLIPPRITPTISPQALQLINLEGQFQDAVATGGGKAFAEWFAPDAVLLSNGKPAVQGRGAIAAQAQWSPAAYQLTWITEGAQISDSADMGFTWGHYDGRTIPADGKTAPVLSSGRYFTVWRKGRDGTWKVAMDASADEPPNTPACCTVISP